jgi:hypothetical protein
VLVLASNAGEEQHNDRRGVQQLCLAQVVLRVLSEADCIDSNGNNAITLAEFLLCSTQ